MKSAFGATFFASALALVAGCSSGAPGPSGDDTATNSESLRRGPGGGRPGGGGNSDPCALVRCAAGTSCVTEHGRASCEPDAPSSCAAVSCLTGSTCEVVNGLAVCTPNEPTPSGPFCGGFAGIECPGAGSCVDDASDDCDPERGGADCGGTCECGNVLALCIEGTVFDQSPDVCACVPTDPELDPCATVRCAAGTSCVVVDGAATCEADASTNPCALVLCAPDTTCEVVDGDAVCTPVAPSGPFCGGIAGIECPGAGSCVDDASDGCDPERGGADCGGVCECNVRALCIQGLVFDESPAVCQCVPRPEENPCALVDCFPGNICEVVGGEPVCTPVEPPNPCAAVLCAPGRVCVADGSEARCERRGRRPGRR